MIVFGCELTLLCKVVHCTKYCHCHRAASGKECFRQGFDWAIKAILVLLPLVKLSHQSKVVYKMWIEIPLMQIRCVIPIVPNQKSYFAACFNPTMPYHQLWQQMVYNANKADSSYHTKVHVYSYDFHLRKSLLTFILKVHDL